MIRRSQFLEYVDRFPSCRVIVIGPSVLEVDVPCDMPHLAADRPMPAIAYSEHSDHPGSAALTAATVAALGGHVTLVTPLGTGAIGKRLAAVADLNDVEIVNVSQAVSCPQLARFLTAHQRQLLQLRRDWHAFEAAGDGNPTLDQSQIERIMASGDDGLGCVCVVDGQPRMNHGTMVQALIEAAGSRGHLDGLRCSPRQGAVREPLRDGAFDHLICNETECRALNESRTGNGHGAPDALQAARGLAGTWSRHVVLTQGPNGVTAVSAGANVTMTPIPRRFGRPDGHWPNDAGSGLSFPGSIRWPSQPGRVQPRQRSWPARRRA
ncbi:MAG: hypothetical protein HND57_11230 [Planctomycetes bacterium]|nr:hypothetical protein [Planctomycetota bacterium]